jgi:hypothetical protein
MNMIDAVNHTLISHMERMAKSIASDTIITVANRIERPNSRLCNCATSWSMLPYAHACHCTAVIAAAEILDGLTPTLHSEQCQGCTP